MTLGTRRIGMQARACLMRAVANVESTWNAGRPSELAIIGPDAGAAIPALQRLLGDADLEVREAAKKALDRITHRAPR